MNIQNPFLERSRALFQQPSNSFNTLNTQNRSNPIGSFNSIFQQNNNMTNRVRTHRSGSQSTYNAS